MRTLASITGLFIFLVSGQGASAFCLSDLDLKIVLINSQIESFDALAGMCIARQPDLAEQGANALSAFHATYSDNIAYYKKLGMRAFQRAGLNADAIDALRETNQSASATIADHYSHLECKNLLLGFEALARAKNFGPIEKLALSAFKTKRTSVPACPGQ